MTVTLHTSSKIVTTWYYHEQRKFPLSYCQLYFRTVCKYIAFATRELYEF